MTTDPTQGTPGSPDGRAQDGQVVYVTPGGAIFAERLGLDGWFGTNGGYARDLAELRAEYGPVLEMRLTDPTGREG